MNPSVNFGQKPVRRFLFFAAVYPFAALGLLVCVVTFTPLVSWWGRILAGPWNDPKGDLLIVLGGSYGPDGIIGGSSYLRSHYAVLAYRRGRFHTLVLAGGGQPVPVATSMRDFLACEGVPRAAMLTETASNSTRENALFTTKLLEGMPGKKVLLSSDFHMFRAHRVFRKLGLETLPQPIPDVSDRASSWRGRWPAFLDLLEETLKIGYYFARGWI